MDAQASLPIVAAEVGVEVEAVVDLRLLLARAGEACVVGCCSVADLLACEAAAGAVRLWSVVCARQIARCSSAGAAVGLGH